MATANKTKRGGVWFVRWRNGRGYRQASLGVAATNKLREGNALTTTPPFPQRRATRLMPLKEARAAGPRARTDCAVRLWKPYVAERDKR